MFMQAVIAKVKDRASAEAANERWLADVRPSAVGFLGATVGVAADNTFVAVARFESEDAARQNNDLPAQTAWYEETSKIFDGDPVFYDCPEVDLGDGGGSDDARFVQVMVYRPKDVAPVKEMAKKMQGMDMPRKDVLGSVTGYATDGTVVDVIYFTNEAEAREGEKMEMPAEFQELMQGWDEANIGEVRYIDLVDPWLT